eukprot:TRINITY_DN55886_c0_g1_i1.p1 TRINITY_DN55886_c0_g1~~TRINITY_DN55886_c0_g1_i1.p1  ORF type:complete len:354 (-),score=77.95 TRINITY_DN55886_c0_g1_i1:186-1172(-)
MAVAGREQTPAVAPSVADMVPASEKEIVRVRSAGASTTCPPSCIGDEESCASEFYESCDESWSDTEEPPPPAAVPAAGMPLARARTVPCLSQVEALSTEYPADLIVQNTFLDFVPVLVEGFVPRLVQSAPCSPVSRRTLDDLDGEDTRQASSIETDDDEQDSAQLSSSPSVPVVQMFSNVVRPLVAYPSMATIEEHMPCMDNSPLQQQTQEHMPCMDDSPLQQQTPEYFPPLSALDVRVADDKVFEPQLGSPAVPSLGSMLHQEGQCKPCAFFWKQGCDNGVNCIFCHLCDSNEKKRRQKEKKALIKEQIRSQQWQTGAMSTVGCMRY